MSRADSCCHKRRRHSSEPSPSQLSISEKPVRKKLYFEFDLEIEPTMINGNDQEQATIPLSSSIGKTNINTQGNVSMTPQNQQSLFTDNDVNRLAQAVKTITLDDLRKELKLELTIHVNNITAPLYTEIEQLKVENQNLKKLMSETQRLTQEVDNLEQHSRESCIRVSCVPETKGEDTTQIVCDIADKLSVKIYHSEISASHRLPTVDGPRQIIASFIHSNNRTELLKSTTKNQG